MRGSDDVLIAGVVVEPTVDCFTLAVVVGWGGVVVSRVDDGGRDADGFDVAVAAELEGPAAGDDDLAARADESNSLAREPQAASATSRPAPATTATSRWVLIGSP